jgi:hypothetical protein
MKPRGRVLIDMAKARQERRSLVVVSDLELPVRSSEVRAMRYLIHKCVVAAG